MNKIFIVGVVDTDCKESGNHKSVDFKIKFYSLFKTAKPNNIEVFVFGKREILDATLIQCRKGNKIMLEGELVTKTHNSLNKSVIVCYYCPELIKRFEKNISLEKFINLQNNYFTNDDQKVYKPLNPKKINFNKIKTGGK